MLYAAFFLTALLEHVLLSDCFSIWLRSFSCQILLRLTALSFQTIIPLLILLDFHVVSLVCTEICILPSDSFNYTGFETGSTLPSCSS